MSIFASDTQQTIPIDLDPPHTVTIRKLRGREFEQAQLMDKRAAVSGYGWANLLRAKLLQGTALDTEVLRDTANNPLLGMDRYVIVTAGLIGWTYHDGAPPTADQIADLDDDAVDFLARAILRLSKPSLFVPAEVAQKETVAPASVLRGPGATAA